MAQGFEENLGAIVRRLRSMQRAVRWRGLRFSSVQRTLLVELNWRLGDEIMALPVIDALGKAYPDVALDVLTNYPDLFEDNPAVRLVNPLQPDPDRYLLLRGAPRQTYRLQAYCETAGIAIPAARPKLYYRDWTAPQLSRLPEGDGPLVALATGASWPSKRWPETRWNALAGQLHAAGCRIIVLGQAGEGLASGTDFTATTSVREAACLLHASDVLVCCDSGLMHLSLAAGTPVVALFGPTDPAILIREEPRFTPVCSTGSCQGFWNHAETVGAPGVCPEGHGCCLESITVPAVVDAVLRQLDRPAPYPQGRP